MVRIGWIGWGRVYSVSDFKFFCVCVSAFLVYSPVSYPFLPYTVKKVSNQLAESRGMEVNED